MTLEAVVSVICWSEIQRQLCWFWMV